MNNYFYHTNLPPHLRVLKDEIEGYARDYGLDFFETIFEVVDADELNQIAAYGGFPTRYPHWSFGMQYEELKKSYEYGLSKIYEMVINNDPCYAYLMRCNHTVDQKLVMAHVYGHCDFFKNNAYFAHTTRKMMDEIANHGARVRRHAERFGEDEVEKFLDRCQSLDDLIDIHSVAFRRRPEPRTEPAGDQAEEDSSSGKFKSKDYMEDYINPPDVLHAQEEEKRKKGQQIPELSFPESPQKDVLLFLLEHAPLRPWQRDILSVVRDEAYYFYPQAQTKILNEGWACLVSGSLVVTDQGFRRIDEVARERLVVRVSDGTECRAVYDWAVFPDRATVRVRTRRGLEVEGSRTHRVMTPDGGWVALGDVAIGRRVKTARGANLWATELVRLDWQPPRRRTLHEAAAEAGVSVETLIRFRDGRRVRRAEAVAAASARYDADVSVHALMNKRRAPVTIPGAVDERLAAFLGYLTGDGHVSDIKRTIGLTTGDESQADDFARLTAEIFGITPRKVWDQTKWRVKFSSRTVQAFLQSLGLKTGFSARVKEVPDVILRSPKPVVAAFLRALYDCDGYAGPAGVILSTSSARMGQVVQLLLLNFGVLSTRRPHKDGCWHVHTQGRSAEVFRAEVGFGLARKQARLKAYVEDRRWFKTEDEADEIIEVTTGRADVFDVSVAETHRYVAQGLVNHNSYWHSTIMTTKALHPSELIDYADHHSGTMAMSGGRLNPYKVGIELLRDVEERWNKGQFGPEWEDCDDMEKKRAWDKQTGLGRQKIFEVRRIHNDITFIDTFLTPEFCARHKLFSFGYNEQTGQYVIDSRAFDKIKKRLLFSLTNFGKPWIYVVNGNFRNRGELVLKHEFNGIDLKLNHARDVLVNLHIMWARPVHLETVVDGKPTLLSFDGSDHTQKLIGGEDNARRDAGGKAR